MLGRPTVARGAIAHTAITTFWTLVLARVAAGPPAGGRRCRRRAGDRRRRSVDRPPVVPGDRRPADRGRQVADHVAFGTLAGDRARPALRRRRRDERPAAGRCARVVAVGGTDHRATTSRSPGRTSPASPSARCWRHCSGSPRSCGASAACTPTVSPPRPCSSCPIPRLGSATARSSACPVSTAPLCGCRAASATPRRGATSTGWRSACPTPAARAAPRTCC